jgi:hypothetical protein
MKRRRLPPPPHHPRPKKQTLPVPDTLWYGRFGTAGEFVSEFLGTERKEKGILAIPSEEVLLGKLGSM